ncbi:hypothetical protein BH23VER1_BH23VER1_16740 [soil metagenome]
MKIPPFSLFSAAVLASVLVFPPAASAQDAPDAPAVSDDRKKELMEIGQKNIAYCMACHGADGQGLQVGPLKMAPTFTNSPYINADPSVPIQIVLRGIQKEDAKYAGIMAPLAAVLDDEKLAGVLTYVRNSYENSAGPVTPEQVAAVREETKGETTPLTRAGLDKLIAEEEGEGEAEGEAEKETE